MEGELHNHTGPFSSVRVAGTFTDYAHAELDLDGDQGTRFAQRFGAMDVLARHDRLGPFASGAIGARAQGRAITTGGSLRTPSTDDLSLAGFVVEEIGAGPVRLQGGLRWDWARYEPRRRAFVNVNGARIATLPRTFGSASGSLGALWAVADGVRLGGSVSRAYRTPDFNELYSDGPHLAAYSYDVGNPRLGQETGLGFDAFARVQRGAVRAELAAYRNALDGYVFPRNTGEVGRVGQRPKFQYTGVNALLTGAEGDLEWSVSPRLVLEGSGSYVLGRLRGAPDSLPAVDGEPARLGARWLPFIPPPNARFGARYERPRWFAGLATRMAAPQRRTGDFETPTAGYALADATLGLRFLAGSRLHAVTLRLDNLLDTEWRDHLSRTRIVMPEAGRNASVLYRILF
jgi:iron complex outermembrane receptor protein